MFGSSRYRPCQLLLFSVFENVRYSRGRAEVPHCAFNLHLPAERLFEHLPRGILDNFFSEMPLLVFRPFKTQVVCVFLVDLWELFVFWIQVSPR